MAGYLIATCINYISLHCTVMHTGLLLLQILRAKEVALPLDESGSDSSDNDDSGEDESGDDRDDKRVDNQGLASRSSRMRAGQRSNTRHTGSDSGSGNGSKWLTQRKQLHRDTTE